jgi:DNA mismatch repair protein MutL
VVHHIAAGEVIDSLVAAVRELVENALDARASHLIISLWPDLGRVRVADNGTGMAPSDLVQAAIPHSTSKIRDQQDLGQIQSLGFRGEALHSLAQVGQLEICSRLQSDAAGWRVTYSPEGKAKAVVPGAIAPGTIVTVTDLFARWPARRQRLPSPTRQLKQMQQEIYHLALGHPGVTWTVTVNDKPWLALTPGASARALIPQMVKAIAPADLREGTQILGGEAPSDPAPKATLYTLIGLPDRCHRPRPDWVKIAVNGRLVIMPDLQRAILQAFRHTLPRHRFPLCFIHLTVPPSHIDWNRSPDKCSIYLQGLDQWGEAIQAAIAALLRHNADTLPDHTHQQRVTQLLKTAEPGGDYLPSAGLGRVDLSDPLPGQGGLIAIAQVHDRYILAEQPDGVCLIEQHIAHERVLYERLQTRWEVVPLEIPVVLEQLSEPQLSQLQRLGLTVDPFGPDLWAIRQAPAPLAPRDDLPDALLELSLGGDLDSAQVAIACRTAIRNGTPLELGTMQTLLNDWQQTRNPRTCPHGRPICLTLAETSLARFFRRHWVIGKSHGI